MKRENQRDYIRDSKRGGKHRKQDQEQKSWVWQLRASTEPYEGVLSSFKRLPLPLGCIFGTKSLSSLRSIFGTRAPKNVRLPAVIRMSYSRADLILTWIEASARPQLSIRYTRDPEKKVMGALRRHQARYARCCSCGSNLRYQNITRGHFEG